ncbi:MAG: carboxypeptidase-like regulatory domain-containing protein [Bacteroidetes bacterium]|nr:carboxypeptidase-like regulatory domain-containing protein [Bacteroidota bacterium]
MKKSWIAIAMVLFWIEASLAQTGMYKGIVKDAVSNQAIEFAVVQLQGTAFGAKTDSAGRFEIRNLKPGLYNIEISNVGFKKKVLYEIAVDNSKPTFVEVLLEKSQREIKEVTIKAGRKDKTEESPLSLRTIGVNEIQRNPGGNRDISKVIQSLPGAGSSVGFRNDIIIRGGGPSENRFYLDGIEIPNINHFATQGANGGPVGILNVDFLQDVGYFSGSFPANRGNTLSSVFDFKMKNPRSDGWHGAFTLGSSDIGLRAEGPVNDKSGLMLSIRRSYLKFLFQSLKLPFLPTYNDVQIKYKYSIDSKNEITYILLGAYDVAVLNKNENETDEQKYILNVLPEQKQWNYTNGIIYKHYKENSFQTIVLSRNMLDNNAYKYTDNDESKPTRLQYQSQEIENKLRIENTLRKNDWKINYGLGTEYVKYNNRTYNVLNFPGGINDTIDYKSAIEFVKYGLFTQVSKPFFNNSLTLSAGLRMDGNTYSKNMQNSLQQLSPRVSASYAITDRLNVNFNTGIYYQTPALTTLGFKDSTNRYINRENNLKYMRCAHLVGGVEYSNKNNARFTIEGFYKGYSQYPQSVRRGISLANEGGDFGVVGNESVLSLSIGRSYGIEWFAQQKLFKGFYGLMAVTLFRSEFVNANKATYAPSNWDQRYIINLTAGKKLQRNWELGAKFRLTGGRPFTPYDTARSSITYIWDVTNQGQIDYSRVNENRLPINHQLDIRVDKKYFFKHWNLNLFLDIQNVYKFSAKDRENLSVVRDANGQPLFRPQ